MKIVHFNQLCRIIPYSWNFDPYIIFLFFIWWEALIKFSSSSLTLSTLNTPLGYGPFKKPNPIIRIILETYFFQMHYSWFYLSCHASHIILCLVWMHTVESLKFVGINFHGLSTFLSWFIFVSLLVHLTGMHNVWKLGFIIIQMTWINK